MTTDRSTLTHVKPMPRQGEETRKNNLRRQVFPAYISDYDKYFKGKGLDIGYRGYHNNIDPIVEGAIGVDTDYPGYDGIKLPFPTESMDFIHSSHCLEHVEDYVATIQEWYRVLKVGGYMIVTVPSQTRYEKKRRLPSRWNRDHKRFYTPAKLLREFEVSLPINGYRVERLMDNDQGYDYTIGPEKHAVGCYEIELIICRLEAPQWTLD